jgi:hypothetical protein
MRELVISNQHDLILELYPALNFFVKPIGNSSIGQRSPDLIALFVSLGYRTTVPINLVLHYGGRENWKVLYINYSLAVFAAWRRLPCTTLCLISVYYCAITISILFVIYKPYLEIFQNSDSYSVPFIENMATFFANFWMIFRNSILSLFCLTSIAKIWRERILFVKRNNPVRYLNSLIFFYAFFNFPSSLDRLLILGAFLREL